MKLFTFLIILIQFFSFSNQEDVVIEQNVLQFENETSFPTHFVDLKCKAKSIPVRNRILSKKELMQSQINDSIGRNLNKTTIVKYINNNELIYVLSNDTQGFYKIKINNFDKANITTKDSFGYIISKYCKQNTITEIKKNGFDRVTMNDQDDIDFFKGLNCNNLKYTYFLIGWEDWYRQFFTFDLFDKNKMYYNLYTEYEQYYTYRDSGIAYCSNAYNKNGEIIFVYKPKNKLIKEIHVSKKSSLCFLIVQGVFFQPEFSPIGYSIKYQIDTNDKYIMHP